MMQSVQRKKRVSLPALCPEIKGTKVLICSQGSRGDIQPFAALARGMQAAGFNVLVFTNPEQEKLVTDLGIAHRSNGANFKEFFVSEESQKAFMANNFLKFLDILGKHNLKIGSTLYKCLYKCIEEFKPDLILSATQHWGDAVWIPILFRIPCIPVNLSNCHTVDPAKGPFGLPTLPFRMNGPMWHLCYNMAIKDAKKAYGDTLSQLSGKPVDDFFPTAEEFMAILGTGPMFGFVPYVIAQDDKMVGRREVDAPNLVYTGSYYLPPDECKGGEFGGDMEAALTTFLQQCGENNRPVYIGWGSLKGADADWLSRFAVKTLKCVGCKGIILEGWAGLKEELLRGDKDEAGLLEYSRKNILWMKTAAHETLFPECSVIVHHGGIGTTQVALRSGRPSIITPVFYDQFDSGEMVEARKVGFATKQLGKTKPEDLAEKIKQCLSDKFLQQRAVDLADQLNSRNGIKECVQVVIKFMKEQVDTGKYLQNFEKIAVEKQQKSRKSTLAKVKQCTMWVFSCGRRKRTWYHGQDAEMKGPMLELQEAV